MPEGTQPWPINGLPGRLIEDIANSTQDWESWLSPEGRLLWVNPAVERMTGQRVEACLAMNDYPLPLVHPEDRARIAAHLLSAAAGSSGRDVEFRLVDLDGAPRWGALSWSRLDDERGGPLGFRTSVRDITSRKRAEADTSDARAQAERSGVALSKFLAAATHDLRQPIQAAGLFTAALHRRSNDPGVRDLAKNIGQCLTATRELLDSLLDISRLDARALKPELEPVALADLLERLEMEFAGPAEEQGLRLTVVNSSLFVGSDPRLLYRILQNFAANALRYTAKGGIVVGVRRNAASARIEIWDSGIGIADTDIPRIFQEFLQLGQGAENGGMGLGLAIVERMALLIGAEVGVRSVPGHGSVFWVSLPLVEPLGAFAGQADEALEPAEVSPRERAGHQLVHALVDRMARWLPLLVFTPEAQRLLGTFMMIPPE